MDRNFVACKQRVFNRGKPSDDFLNQLVDWGATASEEIFVRNDRIAAMLEVLRVLAGFESSWDWNAGRDITNPNSNQPCTEEAGVLQVSGDSMNFDASLKDLVRRTQGNTDCTTFRATTKSNHPFALEYCARLLRFTTNHHGPVKRKEINEWLRRDAMAELLGFL